MTTVEKLQKRVYQGSFGHRRDILATISENTRLEGVTLSNLVLKTRMAHDLTTETLGYPIANGMAVQSQYKNRFIFQMTPKGALYLEKLNELKAMVESVGLRL